MDNNHTFIVPDIHADLVRLETSLDVAGSMEVAFLGDFIDGGKFTPHPDDRAVLWKVKSMIERHQAIGVMGNHELNSILYHRRGSTGKPLREHTETKASQHATFIEAFGIATTEAMYWTDWMLEALPLWRDEGAFRMVHACWNEEAIDVISSKRPDGFLKSEDLEEISRQETEFAKAVDLLVCGPEASLPKGYSFKDYKNVERTSVRLAWWAKAAPTWREAALSVPDLDELPDCPLEHAEKSLFYANTDKPVFVGHYKMKGKPKITALNVACLDYPRQPCMYQFDSEVVLKQEKLIILPA